MKKLLFLVFLFLAVPLWAGQDVTTLQELEQDVKNNLAVASDPYYPDSVLDDFINLACRDLASYGVIIKADSVVVTAGDFILALNEDFLEAIAVFPCTSTASEGLDRIHFTQWGKLTNMPQLTSADYYTTLPEHVTDYSAGILTGAKLMLYPAHSGVDDTLIVIYSAEANELSANADTSNIPYTYRALVGYYATALCFLRSQEYDRANVWFSLYDQMLKQKLLYRQYGFDYIIKPGEIQR